MMASFDLGFPPSRYRSDRPGYNGTSLQTFFAAFPDDDACLEYLFEQRFGSDPTCSRCGRRGRWRRHEWQKHYFHPCGGICSPLNQTIFTRTRIPLQLWFYAMLCFSNSAEGMSSPYLARHLGVSEPTAFHMGHHIRAQMALVDQDIKVGGPGKNVLVRTEKLLRIKTQKTNSRNYAYLLLASDGNRVTASIFRNPARHIIKSLLSCMLEDGSTCNTDCFFTFRAMNAYGFKKPLAMFDPLFKYNYPKQAALTHGLMQYINLSFHDQYRGVNIENSWLYIKEYQFKYNRRSKSSDVFWDLISIFPHFDAAQLAWLRQRHLRID